MFAKATYLGFYPLGSDIDLHGIKIMQAAWNHYKLPVIVFGKNTVSPLFSSVYYVTEGQQTVFFSAIEHGLGHYHIFLIDAKTQQRLRKRVHKNLVNPHNFWYSPFLKLNLFGGTLIPLEEDEQDMLEIRWPDGMWIDVGFVKESHTYFITTVADDTTESWNNPLSVIEVIDRSELPHILQQEIARCKTQHTV